MLLMVHCLTTAHSCCGMFLLDFVDNICYLLRLTINRAINMSGNLLNTAPKKADTSVSRSHDVYWALTKPLCNNADEAKQAQKVNLALLAKSLQPRIYHWRTAARLSWAETSHCDTNPDGSARITWHSHCRHSCIFHIECTSARCG
jgi:hypothetical protein